MWDALKSDLFDFVNTIQSDTSNTLQKVLGEDELNQEVRSSTVLQRYLICSFIRKVSRRC